MRRALTAAVGQFARPRDCWIKVDFPTPMLPTTAMLTSYSESLLVCRKPLVAKRRGLPACSSVSMPNPRACDSEDDAASARGVEGRLSEDCCCWPPAYLAVATGEECVRRTRGRPDADMFNCAWAAVSAAIVGVGAACSWYCCSAMVLMKKAATAAWPVISCLELGDPP